MLDTFDPVALVAGSISPVHLSIAHSLIINVVSVIDISTLPSKGAHSIFLVVYILPLEPVALWIVHHFSPLATAMLHSVFELARVDAAVLPLVYTFALGLSSYVVARVDVTVRKNVRAFPVLETVRP